MQARQSSLQQPSDIDLDRITSFADWCKRLGISPATGRRLLKSGKGPVITWLSERRMGIRERHNLQWLDARGEKPAA
jgi:hypothetical protein